MFKTILFHRTQILKTKINLDPSVKIPAIDTSSNIWHKLNITKHTFNVGFIFKINSHLCDFSIQYIYIYGRRKIKMTKN